MSPAGETSQPIKRTVRSTETHFVSSVEYIAQKVVRESIRIINPRYAAEIERLVGSEDWAIQKLRLSSDADFQAFCADMTGADYFASKVLDTAGLASGIQNGARVYDLKESVVGPDTVIDAKLDGLGSRKPGSEQVPIRLYFITQGPSVPVRTDLELSKNKVSFCTIMAKDSSGRYLPESCSLWANGYFSADREPVETNKYRFLSVNSDIDTTLCMFTHYGLPEPVGTSGGSSSWLIVLIVATIVTTIWLINRLRRNSI